MQYKYGKHVRANFSGKETVGHLTKDAYDVPGDGGAEQKYGVTDWDGTEHPMAYTKLDSGESVPGGYFTDAN